MTARGQRLTSLCFFILPGQVRYQFTDSVGMEVLAGLGEKFEPGTYNRLHTTTGTAFDCDTTRLIL